jgi:broad specificity phosphatase PhoE
VRLVLVRHGQAAAGWGTGLDPGLDDVGRAQAAATADVLAPLGPLPIVASPMRRTIETAAPLAARWGVEPVVDQRVSEIAAPTDDLDERTAWLGRAMTARWSELGPEYVAWRAGVGEALTDVATRYGDAVIVTHFVCINAAVGFATGDDRFRCFVPDNCSRTTLEVDGGGLRLVELGAERVTRVR